MLNRFETVKIKLNVNMFWFVKWQIIDVLKNKLQFLKKWYHYVDVDDNVDIKDIKDNIDNVDNVDKPKIIPKKINKKQKLNKNNKIIK